jgi:hypothetical protein
VGEALDAGLPADQARRVVANFVVDLVPIARRDGVYARGVVEVLPDRPTARDLRALGRGGPSEEKAGLLVLDECATWLNARTWSGREREDLIDWFLHSRKLGWDVILICQHASALDKQVREMICEYLVTCRRLDRFKVPLLGFKLPKVHVASVRYGLAPSDLNAEHWIYRGTRYYDCYNTQWESQASRDAAKQGGTLTCGWYSVLPAWHRVFRHQKVRSWRDVLPTWLWLPLMVLLLPVYVLVGAFSSPGSPERKKPQAAGRFKPANVFYPRATQG